ncbi:MAG TPA: NAD(P)-dependent oxidoreductase [Demequina sp.]|nr:NAD(P)-dependent oxidoreductase [Demequina sp.]
MNTVTVVAGANGFVGSQICRALLKNGETVRAVVRRAGSMVAHPGLEEWVGDFADPVFATNVCAGARSVVTTVHPMASDFETQRKVGVDGTSDFARAARDAGVELLIHISTAGVYERESDTGDVKESSRLVSDAAGPYAVTKRDAEASLENVTGLTRVFIRPPAILGTGESSTWNSILPAQIRDDEAARHAVPDRTFAWVHVNDLASFAADIATRRVATSNDPEVGPVPGSTTAVNVAAPAAKVRDYYVAVTTALGVAPIWDDQPAWTGRLVADRARAWGWSPTVGLEQAMVELVAPLSGTGRAPSH